ncbi:flagellar assembly protein FliW [Clostridium thermarum]|uniref:flagellar assembly protein FliW n=1 Tax=Clostridium thermarum TaxID=1716543 RepID=UPI001120B50E|nr:flagellar assembly protein FliW [Clostridium thermarum]
MKLNTKYHGVKEYSEKDVINFKNGLPGFENLKKFILFPVEENDVFSILQSIEDEGIGLVTISPFSVMKDYEFKLNDDLLEGLKIRSEQDVLVLSTVTLSTRLENITVNLKAPIIVNINERLGEQIILDNDKYMIKHPLVQE